MQQIKKYTISFAVVLALMFCAGSVINTASAQCPMCRMSAESNLRAGGTAGKGLNRGILYLFAMPYLLVGTIGFVWWKNQTTEDDIPLSPM
ncbi:MAG: hypothetical protein DRI69_09330 [Bacteroidetes bacterium]|nr:MAG: hypothetical protein DRI69_09330 [Bacteroidota bacterium]